MSSSSQVICGYAHPRHPSIPRSRKTSVKPVHLLVYLGYLGQKKLTV
jgi:hypothetical protein